MTTRGRSREPGRTLQLVATGAGARTSAAVGRGEHEPVPGHPDRRVPYAAPVDDAPDGTLVGALDDTVAALRAHGPTILHRAALTDLLGSWAAGLADLHARPVGARVEAVPRPWVLEHDPLPRWLGDLPVDAGLAWAVRQHPRVRGALREARDGWRSTHWVHGGDADDVLLPDEPGQHPPEHEGDAPRTTTAAARPGVVGPGTPPPSTTGAPGAGRTHAGGPAPTDRTASWPPSTVRGTGRGDARWDVATALDWIAVNLVPALDAGWDLDPVRSFMTAYRERGGQAEPTRAIAVARTVTTAIEWSLDLGPEPTVGSGELRWVAALWGRPLTLVAAARRR